MHRTLFLLLLIVGSSIALLFAPSTHLSAQNNLVIEETELELKALFDTIHGSFDDNERIESGIIFSAKLHKALTLDGSFEYPFSHLPNLSKVTSSDERVRIYTWNIPLHSGMNKFYGIIQFHPTTSDSLVVIDLADQFEMISLPDQEVLSPEKWYGAIYYKAIKQQTLHGQVFYTLLGWRGENMLVTSRLIDILTITPSRDLRFGKTVFCDFAENRPARIIFRYNANVTMSLRYEEQSIVASKKWNSRRKEFTYKTEKAWLIVCDRLIPSNPEMEGQYEYYMPAGDVMDGFIFKDGCWKFIKKIDARNPEKK